MRPKVWLVHAAVNLSFSFRTPSISWLAVRIETRLIGSQERIGKERNSGTCQPSGSLESVSSFISYSSLKVQGFLDLTLVPEVNRELTFNFLVFSFIILSLLHAWTQDKISRKDLKGINSWSTVGYECFPVGGSGIWKEIFSWSIPQSLISDITDDQE